MVLDVAGACNGVPSVGRWPQAHHQQAAAQARDAPVFVQVLSFYLLDNIFEACALTSVSACLVLFLGPPSQTDGQLRTPELHWPP